jgi:hypothetical protein
MILSTLSHACARQSACFSKLLLFVTPVCSFQNPIARASDKGDIHVWEIINQQIASRLRFPKSPTS